LKIFEIELLDTDRRSFFPISGDDWLDGTRDRGLEVALEDLGLG
jgi:hypothetical protein